MSTPPRASERARDAEGRPVTHDIALFERLNEEYRQRPLAPTPPAVDPEGLRKRARRRLRTISRSIDLRGKRVVEIGCSHGYLTRQLVKKGKAREAIGVDIVESPMWEQHASPAVSFHRADLARERLLDDGSVDAVVSTAVLEHVDRPLRMLEAIARMLKAGGEAWLYFNLYRGPKASHRYREIYFPWPHLLFEPEICEAFYRKHYGRGSRFSWVNRLTAAEYVAACIEGGLEITDHRRSVTPIDIPFYVRFEDVLARYPALDLETDFMRLSLGKRRRPPRRAPSLGYIERQREFDEEIRRWAERRD
jgi:SAM-dependent methyltransferase